MKKISMFIICCLLWFNVSVGRIVSAEEEVSEYMPVQLVTNKRTIVRYYSLKDYKTYLDFPFNITYNDGNQYGILEVVDWYVSATHFVVTYSGHVGPFAPLSVELRE
ncbi:hypothetical protein JDW15_09685 [Aerococcaceae bacterium zg-ZJ1578]|uniref:hypothetical protein n=1 Tax=Aerococcaceae bacterium zg-252 TaxID=2796928 RepID=UPI001A2D2EB1|nr:hypothetical protein [Aerococcaceae bacterium zg-1578]